MADYIETGFLVLKAGFFFLQDFYEQITDNKKETQ